VQFSAGAGMAGAVVVWLGAFARSGSGQPEAGQAAEAAEADRRRQFGGDDDGDGAAASVKKGEVQEKRRRNSGVLLSDSETVVCMLTDRFAPA